MPNQTVFVGAQFEYSLKITPELIEEFSRFSGDYNPIHLDSSFAQEVAGMPNRVAHGMISGAVFSRLFGMHLPGPGCLWHSQSLDFLVPIFVGNVVNYKIECIGEEVKSGAFKFSTTAEVNGRICISGSACVSLVMPRAQLSSGSAESPSRAFAPNAGSSQANSSGKECVLVIGASSEIGRACIDVCLREFPRHMVLAVSNNREVSAVHDSLEDNLLRIDKYDVTSPDKSLDRLKLFLIEHNLIVSKLIYAASPSIEYRPLDRAAGHHFAKFFYGNVGGIADLISMLFAVNRMSTRAAAVVVSSSYVNPPAPHELSPYIVAKTALISYVQCASAELAKRGFRINAVSPGFLDSSSNIMVPAKAKIKARTDSHTKSLTNPGDVASTILFLLSDATRQITGENIFVSGGK